MVQKSGDHQLRLVVYAIIYRVSKTSQVVQDFLNHQQLAPKKLGIGRWFSFWKGFLVGATLVSGRVTCPLNRDHFIKEMSSSHLPNMIFSGGVLVLGRVKKLNFVDWLNFQLSLQQIYFDRAFFDGIPLHDLDKVTPRWAAVEGMVAGPENFLACWAPTNRQKRRFKVRGYDDWDPTQNEKLTVL